MSSEEFRTREAEQPGGGTPQGKQSGARGGWIQQLQQTMVPEHVQKIHVDLVEQGNAVIDKVEYTRENYQALAKVLDINLPASQPAV